MATSIDQKRSLPLVQASCCGSSVPVGFRVRDARASDLPRVIELLKGSDLPVEGVDEQFGQGFAVAVDGERVIGAIGIERYGAYGLLRSAVVSVGDRGRGVGEALVLDRIDWSMRQGLSALYLLTTSAPEFF